MKANVKYVYEADVEFEDKGDVNANDEEAKLQLDYMIETGITPRIEIVFN